MSIFDKHKNGRPPVIPAAETPAATPAGHSALLAEAVARGDWHNVWRYYRQSGQELPGNGDAVLPLAQYLAGENRPDDALSLLQGFAGRYPEHPDVVKNYLLAVHIMRRDFGDAEGARELLGRLAERYANHPDHPLIVQQQENAP